MFVHDYLKLVTHRLIYKSKKINKLLHVLGVLGHTQLCALYKTETITLHSNIKKKANGFVISNELHF